MKGRHPRSERLFLGACVLAALLLYLFRIGAHSLWLDEVMSLSVARMEPGDMMGFFRGLPEQHPAYYLLLHGWLALGESEAALRGLSVLFAVLTLVPFHALARRTLPHAAAWVATLLLVFSPFWLFYAQEARMYTLLGFLTVLHSRLFLRRIEAEESSRAPVTAYVAVGVVGAYTHFFFLFVPLSHLVWHLAEEREWRRSLRLAGWPVAAVYAAYLPWAIFLLLNMPEEQSWKGLSNVVFGVPYSFFRFSVGYSELLANAGWKSRVTELVRQNWLVLAAAGLGWGLALMAGVREAWRRRGEARFLLAGLTVPIAAALVVSLRTIVVGERYLVVGFPFYLALAALGLWALWRSGGRARIAGLAAAALVVATTANSLHGHFYDDAFGKEQWGEVARTVASSVRSGDVVDFHRDFVEGPFRYYYRQISGPELSTAPGVAPPAAAAGGRLWVVVSHVLTRSRCLEELESRYRVEERWRFPKGAGIELYLLAPRREGASGSGDQTRRILDRYCP